MKKETCLLCGKNNFSLLIDKSRDGGKDKNYICENCGFICIFPRPDNSFHEEEYREGNFSIVARGMEEPSKYMTRIFNWQALQRMKILEAYEPNLSGKKVLDVGCGAGNFLTYLRYKGCEVTGLEPDKTYTKYAKEKHNLDIKNLFLSEYKTDEKYDLISSFHVIEHVEDPNKFLQECRNLLTDDGILYLECPSIERIYGDTVDYFFWYAHLNTFSADTLSAFLSKNGFEILELGWNKDFVSVIAKKTEEPLNPENYYDPNTEAVKQRVKNYNSLVKPKVKKVLRKLRTFKNKMKKILFNID